MDPNPYRNYFYVSGTVIVCTFPASGSVSFHEQAKKLRTWEISSVVLLYYGLSSLKIDVNIPTVITVKSKMFREKKIFFYWES